MRVWELEVWVTLGKVSKSINFSISSKEIRGKGPRSAGKMSVLN